MKTISQIQTERLYFRPMMTNVIIEAEFWRKGLPKI